MSIVSNMQVLIALSLLQALPIFLDKLLSPVLAVVLSVTAVLLVGKDLCTTASTYRLSDSCLLLMTVNICWPVVNCCYPHQMHLLIQTQ